MHTHACAHTQTHTHMHAHNTLLKVAPGAFMGGALSRAALHSAQNGTAGTSRHKPAGSRDVGGEREARVPGNVGVGACCLVCPQKLLQPVSSGAQAGAVAVARPLLRTWPIGNGRERERRVHWGGVLQFGGQSWCEAPGPAAHLTVRRRAYNNALTFVSFRSYPRASHRGQLEMPMSAVRKGTVSALRAGMGRCG